MQQQLMHQMMQQKQKQQQQQQQQQPTFSTGAFNTIPNTSSITTDHIQQYLDENKALILKILENQNTGNFGECAENQTRLQRNLMYLVAIADCQPKPSPIYLQPSMNSMQHQQLQSQQLVQHSQMMAQSPMMFAQQPPFTVMQQQHHALQSPLGISSTGTSGIHTPRSEASMGGEGPGGFPDFGQTILGEGSRGMSRLENRSGTGENRSTSSNEDGGDKPQKKGKFNIEST